jgi:hypothetical protein
MQKIINKLINYSVKTSDVYRWQESTWLIFTNETRWVLQLTDNGTLWYNLKFFGNLFHYLSIDCNNTTDYYITNWANEFFCKEIKKINEHHLEHEWNVRAVINNGVKKVNPNIVYSKQTGVYHPDCQGNTTKIDLIIENGIKNTWPDINPNDYDWSDEFKADEIISKGLKL